jgi:hypothetical protein
MDFPFSKRTMYAGVLRHDKNQSRMRVHKPSTQSGALAGLCIFSLKNSTSGPEAVSSSKTIGTLNSLPPRKLTSQL